MLGDDARVTDSGSARVPLLANPKGLELPRVDPTKPCGARMKGFPLRHLYELFGTDTLAAWRQTLPPALQGHVDPKAVTSVGWLPIELYFSAVQHLCDTQHGGDPRGAIEIGAATARKDIGAFFMAAMKLASPATIFSLSGRFWRSYYDRAALKLTQTGGTTADALIEGWPLPSAVAYYELAGSFVVWLEASRAKHPKLTRFELLADASLAVTISWQ